MCIFVLIFAILPSGVSALPTDYSARLTLIEKGQQKILAQMGHVTVWKFPQGPMSLGCLIMAAGIALGIVFMCIWMHFQWNEMTTETAKAIQTILRDENRRHINQTTMIPLETVEPLDTDSMMAQNATFDAPPAYNEVI